MEDPLSEIYEQQVYGINHSSRKPQSSPEKGTLEYYRDNIQKAMKFLRTGLREFNVYRAYLKKTGDKAVESKLHILADHLDSAYKVVIVTLQQLRQMRVDPAEIEQYIAEIEKYTAELDK